MQTLRELIAPHLPNDFFDNYWHKNFLHIPGSKEKTEGFFNWEIFSDLLNEHHGDLVAPKLRLFSSDKGFVDITEYLPTLGGGALQQTSSSLLAQYCREGATLVLDQIHKYKPALKRFCHKIEAELGERVQMNCFASWQNAKGFDPHFDSHDLFILQVEGEKKWELSGFTLKNPLPEHRADPFDQPEELVFSGTLAPGDVLYMPRGMWHRTITSELPSLHIAIGINCRTSIDFITWIMEELKSDESLRASLPTSYNPVFSKGYDHQMMGNVMENIYKKVTGFLNDEAVIERYNQHCLMNDRQVTDFKFPFVANEFIINNGANTKFYRPLSQRVIIKSLDDDKGVNILVWGKELAFSGPVNKLITKLFEAEYFTGKDLLSWDTGFEWDDVAPILEQLLVEQIIFIDR